LELSFEKMQSGRYVLKVLGYTCPYPTLYTLKVLEKLSEGEVLEVLTDSQPSRKSIEEKVSEINCKVLDVEMLDNAVWRIVIRKGG